MRSHLVFARPLVVMIVLVTAMGVSVGGLAGGAAAAPKPCPSCGHNLIENPGAEAGVGSSGDTQVPVPDWKPTGGFTATMYSAGEDLSPTSPGPRDRGKNYFYGGPASALSTGKQTVTLPAAAGSGVSYDLTGWLGGYDSQGDYATFTVTFESATGAKVGSARIGPVTEAQRKGVSELLKRTASGSVPATTEKLAFTLKMVRESGSDDDGLADNLSLVFSS
jgi:hypothetical protein